jgi:hypothetical protein
MKGLAIAAVTALGGALLACGGKSGGGGGGSEGPAVCSAIDPELISSGPDGQPCPDCSVDNPANAADRDLYSFATVTISSTGDQSIHTYSYHATYPIGSNVGAFVSLQDSSTRVVTVNTYSGGAPVQSVSGPALTTTPTQGGTGATDYVSFLAAAPFDGVEVMLSGSGAETTVDYVFEICSDGAVE